MSWFVVGEDGEELKIVEAKEREDIDDGCIRINGPFTEIKAVQRKVQREIAAENDTGEFDGDW